MQLNPGLQVLMTGPITRESRMKPGNISLLTAPLLILMLGVSACTESAEEAAPASSSPIAAEVEPKPGADEVIDAIVADGGLPFIHVRVEDDEGAVLYEHTATNRELVPMEINGSSWIRIWSMTKIVTITLAMDMVEDGTIALDDPVTKFIPEFEALEVAVAPDGTPLLQLEDKAAGCPLKTVPVTEVMTVRHLMTHEDGFYYPWSGIDCLDRAFGAANLPASASSDELIRQVAELPLINQPGKAEFYGTGTAVLGLLLERASGKSLQELVEERITGPMGIEGLSYRTPEGVSLPPRISGEGGTLHTASAGELDIFGTQLPEYDEHYPLYFGGEGMVATSDGYLDYARMLLHRGTLNGYRMLDEESIEAITAPHVQLDNPWGHGGYALWISNGRLSDESYGPPLWVGGGYEGTHFWIDPEAGHTGVIMTQVFNAPPAAANFHEKIRVAVYAELAASPE